ncbi:MAG: hypothetical protein SFX72_11885 [Isosphaeraceae bacterium]|nr:hypothetical protein [Isosphaeraceae bacterium]
MRLTHLVGLVFAAGLVFTLCREPAGRVAVIVFGCGLLEIVIGVAALMTLFEWIGSIAEARDAVRRLEACLMSLITTIAGGLMMSGVLWICVALIRWAVPPI